MQIDRVMEAFAGRYCEQNPGELELKINFTKPIKIFPFPKTALHVNELLRVQYVIEEKFSSSLIAKDTVTLFECHIKYI